MSDRVEARHMYVLVRKDLPPAVRAVQASHAAVESARAFLPSDEVHPYFVLCGVEDEKELRKAVGRVIAAGLNVAVWTEPDMGDVWTAAASEPLSGVARDVFRHYKLLRD